MSNDCLAETASRRSGKTPVDRIVRLRLYRVSSDELFDFSIMLPPVSVVDPELQRLIVIHMDDPVTAFSPHIHIPSAAADCLGRPIKRPSPSEPVQFGIGPLNRGKVRITNWRE